MGEIPHFWDTKRVKAIQNQHMLATKSPGLKHFQFLWIDQLFHVTGPKSKLRKLLGHVGHNLDLRIWGDIGKPTLFKLLGKLWS